MNRDGTDEGEFPVPSAADTARLDQLGAHWRDVSPHDRQDVTDAADALRSTPNPDAVARLLDALRRAGMNPQDSAS